MRRYAIWHVFDGGLRVENGWGGGKVAGGCQVMTHLAVSIVARDATEALEKAATLPAEVTLVEYRLDKMARVDVPRLARETPLPAIFTCRPSWEGGDFQGSEEARLGILQEALGTAHWVDVELKTLEEHPHLARMGRVIASQHDFAGMLGDWDALEARARALGARVVKLVGMAQSPDDVLPPLAWLDRARGPAVAIAMGAAGVATRLLAPRFPRAFLTFASLDQATAPGQVTVHDWLVRYGFTQTVDADPLLVALTSDPIPWAWVEAQRVAASARYPDRRPWVLPLPTGQATPALVRALDLAGVQEVIIFEDKGSGAVWD
ncbi:MAG TPA: type I 3-dehydroquinate dehydratase [Anaerolineae bacterium]|nr:type I 3-dehydroquinate dehydratase [Anaerolineae bacterium]